MTDVEDLGARLSACEARFEHDFMNGVGPLRVCLEDVARARVGAAPTVELVDAFKAAVKGGIERAAAREAEALLARAEAVEVMLGSMASGPGEGISSRWSACSLKLARAWLLTSGEMEDATRAAAAALVDAAEAEPNGVGARLAREIQALRGELARRA